ncbi:flagellar filament capping protein FliD [Ferroacidibacillus organovorans]|nr:flagellar filament capping protein FliD [Ferroacidibacillus organovorans]
MSMPGGLLNQLNSIPNAGGIGVPVSQYATQMQSVLETQLLTIPNQEISGYQAQSGALSSLQSALLTLQSAVQTLTGAGTWNQVNASINVSGVTVSAGIGAVPGTYQMNITSLATGQLDVGSVTQSSESGTSTLASGSFTITPTSGTATTINVTSGESLDALVSAINQAQSGVIAGIIQNNGSYQLTMSSRQTGSNAGFTLADVSGTVVAAGLGESMIVAASNATATLDGISISSQTNTFTDIAPGISVTANNTGSGTLSVTANTQGTLSAVNQFMSAYNDVVDLIKNDSTYTKGTNGSPGTLGPLATDATAQSALQMLPQAIMQSIGGSGTLTNLAQAGIVLDPTTGHLEFQSTSGFSVTTSSGTTTSAPNVSLTDGQTTFTNLLNQNPTALENLFGVIQTPANTGIPTSGVLGAVQNALNVFVGHGSNLGTISSEQTSLAAQIKQTNAYITQVTNEINQQVATFTSQLNALNTALANNQSSAQSILALINGGTSASSSSSSSSSGSSIP